MRRRRNGADRGDLCRASQITGNAAGPAPRSFRAFQKTAGPFGTAITGSVLAAAYRGRLDLTGLRPAAAAAVRQSVYGGLAVASHLRSPSLSHSARAAFAHGLDTSLLVSAGTAAAGVILTLTFLPRAAARERSEPPMRVATRVSEP